MVLAHGRIIVGELLASGGVPGMSLRLLTDASFIPMAEESIQYLVNHAYCTAEFGYWAFNRGIGKGDKVEDFSHLATSGLRRLWNIP